jgi:hypothetical protein
MSDATRDDELIQQAQNEMQTRMQAAGLDLSRESSPVVFDKLPAVALSAAQQGNDDRHQPIGSQRRDALQVLRTFTEHIAVGALLEAEETSRLLERDPANPHAASIAGVIGTGASVLDTWYAKPGGGASAKVEIHAIDDQSGRLAKGLVSLARKGRAYSSLTPMIHTHGGFLVLDATLVAVASVIISLAQATGAAVEETAGQILL